jgi:hypothetical protein
VAGVARLTAPVGLHDGVVHAGRIFLEPAEQGRPKIEAHPRVVVHDADDLVLVVDNARGAVRRVAFRGNAFVPIVIGRSAFLLFHGFQPRILARRLVKVAVDTDRSFTAAHDFPHERSDLAHAANIKACRTSSYRHMLCVRQ